MRAKLKVINLKETVDTFSVHLELTQSATHKRRHLSLASTNDINVLIIEIHL